VNVSPGAVTPKLKMILVVVAAVAALTVTIVSTAGTAGAYSGGTSVSGGDGGGGKYKRLWEDTSRRNKRWARRTAECESGKDPNAIGGGGTYRGAFQFMKETWRGAPKSPGGDPIDYSFRTQAVVAVAVKKRHGTGAWPNCG
jgi:hypothetical protein